MILLQKSLKIAVVTLGCSKNRVDSEHLAAALISAGHRVAHEPSWKKMDVAIVNTCGFILDSKKESIDAILTLLDEKKNGNLKQVIVYGCLAQRYKDELKNEMNDVDAFFGVASEKQILEFLKTPFSKLTGRFISTPSHYAYLKIAEGCNRQCSFCAIPGIRGKYISTPEKVLIREAEMLADKGVKELILIAQDLTYYGLEVKEKGRFERLINQLCKISGIEWIRLQYGYPAAFPLPLLDLIKDQPKVCNYLDIPFQHINDRILKSMRRNITSKQTYALIEKIRRKLPDTALRTTLISGYPGETMQEHEELLSFVKEVRFERMGVFSYSHEEGTPAFSLNDDVVQKEKRRRVAQIMKAQQKISSQINQSIIGLTIPAICDRLEGEYYICRSQWDSPEIDGEILVSQKKKLKQGNIYQIKITGAFEFDLVGDVL
ncbi:MAG: 30S ribosomal protein S12 methylthiotransferase RimO [Bacteroidota bacterium]